MKISQNEFLALPVQKYSFCLCSTGKRCSSGRIWTCLRGLPWPCDADDRWPFLGCLILRNAVHPRLGLAICHSWDRPNRRLGLCTKAKTLQDSRGRCPLLNWIYHRSALDNWGKCLYRNQPVKTQIVDFLYIFACNTSWMQFPCNIRLSLALNQ